jgi:hypothetical protein
MEPNLAYSRGLEESVEVDEVGFYFLGIQPVELREILDKALAINPGGKLCDGFFLHRF